MQSKPIQGLELLGLSKRRSSGAESGEEGVGLRRIRGLVKGDRLFFFSSPHGELLTFQLLVTCLSLSTAARPMISDKGIPTVI